MHLPNEISDPPFSADSPDPFPFPTTYAPGLPGAQKKAKKTAHEICRPKIFFFSLLSASLNKFSIGKL